MPALKPPPHSLESEEVVLASCLLDEEGSVYDDVSQILTNADFYAPRNQIIFSTLGKIVADGKPCSEISLSDYLEKEGNLDTVGGLAAIFAIQEKVETSGHAKYSAQIVKEKSKLRQLIRAAKLAAEQAQDGEEEVEKISSALESSIQAIHADMHQDDTIAKSAGDLEEDLKAMLAGTYERKGLKFGIPSIDDKLPDGLIGGTVTVIAAPSSCGKTQAALNCALKRGITDKLPVGIFSYEMPTIQLTRRMAQTAAGVNLARFRDQVATEEDQRRVHEAIQKMKDSCVLTNYTHRTVETMASLTRQWKRRHGIKLLVIDYLQLLESPNNKMSSVESINYNSKRIKSLALELDIPVLLLSQVNREAVKRLAFNPKVGLLMHDLIGASAIEADADNVLMFWPSKGEPAGSRQVDDNGRPYMSISGQFAKYREGQRGIRFEMKFVEQLGRFY
jgi:replicative DNA helicase